MRGQKRPLRLIDLSSDLQEKNDVSAQHPDIVKRLLTLADRIRDELGDTGRMGSGQRPAGRVKQPTARLLMN